MSREVRRVPLDFDHPVGSVWTGYLMPEELALLPCTDCVYETEPGLLGQLFGFSPQSTGYSPQAWNIAESFYPHQVRAAGARRGQMIDHPTAELLSWHDKITQAEVDMLVAEHRLHPWKTHDWVELPQPWAISKGGRQLQHGWVRNDRPNPTADEVNEAERLHHIHDAINRGLLISHRVRQAGVPELCPTCQGHATVATTEQRAAHEAWEKTEPPAGEGWQLWETITEGSPVTPVFASGEALVRWLTTRGEWRPSHGRYAEPYRPAAAEALVRSGATLGTFVDFGSGPVDSARQADAVELEEHLRQ